MPIRLRKAAERSLFTIRQTVPGPPRMAKLGVGRTSRSGTLRMRRCHPIRSERSACAPASPPIYLCRVIITIPTRPCAYGRISGCIPVIWDIWMRKGICFFTGRQAHWLRVKGENVSAHEVEDVLSEYPGVEESIVVGVPAELGDDDVKAFLRVSDRDSFNPQNMVEWCRSRLASFKTPPDTLRSWTSSRAPPPSGRSSAINLSNAITATLGMPPRFLPEDRKKKPCILYILKISRLARFSAVRAAPPPKRT